MFHAGDYDALIPGVYGEPNLSSDESSREIIPLLQRLIKVIEESGPLPEWAGAMQQALGGAQGMPGAMQFGGGTFAGDPAQRVGIPGERRQAMFMQGLGGGVQNAPAGYTGG